MSRVLLFLALFVLGPFVAGCIEPEPVPPGWQRDPETGISWRPLTEAEKGLWNRDEHRIYVFRVPGIMEALREDEEVRFPVRIFGDFEEAHLVYDRAEHRRMGGDQPRNETVRRFDPSPPWYYAAFTLPRHVYLSGDSNEMDRWRYTVMTYASNWPAIDDIRETDLLTFAVSPCAESGPSSGNATAACLRYADPEGY